MNYMVNDSVAEKNVGVPVTRRGLQELDDDNDQSLVTLDQPVRAASTAMSTLASTQVQDEVVEGDEIEFIDNAVEHLVEAIDKAVAVELSPSPDVSDRPECVNPTSSTLRVASPGAVAVGGPQNSSSGEFSITAPATRASTSTENQSTSRSTRPVSARLVPDTEEDYELLEEQLRQKEQQLRQQEQQFQRVLQREHVPIAEVIVNDEEAQQDTIPASTDESRFSNKVLSLLCGSKYKRIAAVALTILVVVGLVVGVVVGIKSGEDDRRTPPSSHNEECSRDLSKADQDDNGMLNQKEYFSFINLFTEGAYIYVDGFPNLPQPLRRNFFQWRDIDANQLHIGGSKEEEVDAEAVDMICTETERTISTLPAPTAPPTQLTSEASRSPTQ